MICVKKLTFFRVAESMVIRGFKIQARLVLNGNCRRTMVFILWVNTNPENWSVNTQLTGIRRNMIHLESFWSLVYLCNFGILIHSNVDTKLGLY